jgi:two-component system nitrate/nitrite response regulator NarL
MQVQTKIRVFLVDDHTVVLDGISARLSDEAFIEVIGTACNGKEAIKSISELRPDVVLMDVSMPVMGGLEATRILKQELPETRVLILSMHDDQEYIINLMKAGAYGYVLKDVSSDELIKAIETVHQGSTYFSSSASQSLFSNFHNNVVSTEHVLTRREMDVLEHIAEGHCNKDIACALNISVRTVETHRLNIKKKLNIHTTAGLTKYAIEQNLVKLS